MNIKPFIKRLIKDNIFYIVGNVALIILIIITIKISLTQNLEYKTKISALKTENISLMNKITVIQKSVPMSKTLDEDIQFLNNMIPNSEDYFSIIAALEKLSKKSNFTITDYTVNINQSTAEKLRLSVGGQGDSQSFIDFLKNYNFYGGRLITSDKVQLDPNFSGLIKIDLTFYSKNSLPENNVDHSINSKIYSELDEIKSKINFIFDEEISPDSENFEYQKKENPF
jgi:hypothetical protein